MSISRDLFNKISTEDTYDVDKDRGLLLRNGSPVPYFEHEKRFSASGRKLRADIVPKFFTYHFSAGRLELNNLVEYMRRKSTKADVQLCLGRKGEVVQLAPLHEKCWHMGRSSYGGYNSLNDYAIGIEVVNPGPLEILGDGQYKSWFNEIYDDIEYSISEGQHHIHGGKTYGWMDYTPEQITAVTNIALALRDVYSTELIGHDEATSRKTDPGPFSKIDDIRAILEGRDDDSTPHESVVEPVNTPLIKPVETTDVEPVKPSPVKSCNFFGFKRKK